MAISTLKRTSMSLDPETLENLDELAKYWAISKAEVIRRAIRKLSEEAKHESRESREMTPIEAIEWLGKNGITQETADKWKAEIKAERMAWRGWWEK
jgi:metal-responsive CopG/Arc/MetJ family transcriptional regulator